MKPHDLSNGELYTLRDFIEMVDRGELNDDDGSGFYATATEESPDPALPSAIATGNISTFYSHVEWYSK